MDEVPSGYVKRGWLGSFVFNAIVAFVSFVFGTVFTPEVQPYIYAVKDRLGGCSQPLVRADKLLREADVQREKSRQKVFDIYQAAYGELEKASKCNTPSSAKALIAMATLRCKGLGVTRNLENAHNLIHRANTIPGASFARAYTAIANCGVLSK